MAIGTAMHYVDGTAVYQWLMDEPSSTLQHLCQEQGLDPSCDAKAESRRRELLCERLLLNSVYGKPMPIMHDQWRKPYLAVPGLEISIAHTKGLLYIACNHDHPIGIDLEYRSDRAIRVRDGYLNASELPWISPADGLAHQLAWTAKEALFKAVNDRTMHYRDDLLLEPFASPTAPSGTLKHSGWYKQRQYALESHFSPSYVFTLCYPIDY